MATPIKSKSYIADVQQDENGDYFLVFPPKSLEGLGWEDGDDIQWIDNLDGSWTLRKIE